MALSRSTAPSRRGRDFQRRFGDQISRVLRLSGPGPRNAGFQPARLQVEN